MKNVEARCANGKYGAQHSLIVVLKHVEVNIFHLFLHGLHGLLFTCRSALVCVSLLYFLGRYLVSCDTQHIPNDSVLLEFTRSLVNSRCVATVLVLFLTVR